jgi:hypothetical protein
MPTVLRYGVSIVSAVVGGALVALAIGFIVLVRTQTPVASLLHAGAPPDTQSADELRTSAASKLEAAITAGGTGLTFEVVQRNTLFAKPDGPRIEIRSDADPETVTSVVDEYYVNAMASRGAVTDRAFWMEMRRGPAKDQVADFRGAELIFSVLERDGVLWRDDGVGWYHSDESPGMGMDPVSARQLPSMLRSLADATSLEPAVIEGRLLVGVRGTARPDDYPGVVAADGKAFTEGSFQVDCWFDDAGRLVRLEVRAQNLNQTSYDLVSHTVVTFGYGSTGEPPDPSPTMAPETLPTSEPEAVVVPS